MKQILIQQGGWNRWKRFAGAVGVCGNVLCLLHGALRVEAAAPAFPPQEQVLPEIGGVGIELEAPFGSAVTNGYVPLKLRFRNTANVPRRVEIKISSEAGFMHHKGGHRGIPLNYVWNVPAAAATPLDAVKILLPTGELIEQGHWGHWRMDVRVGGEFSNGVALNPFSHGNPGLSTVPVAFSDSVGVDLSALATDFFEGSASAHHAPASKKPEETRFEVSLGTTPRALRAAHTNLASLPADPRAFAGIAGFWMAEKEWKQTPQTMQDAALEWVRSGGSLYLTRPEQPGQSAEPLLGLDAQKKDSHRAWGLGRITRVSGWDKNDVSRIKSEVRSLDFSPFPSAQGDYEHWTSKLLDPPRLNIGLLVLFLFGFGILAAPVNLYWIAPRQKRHRLFVSVPLLSLGASALLFGFIISTEGIGGTGIRNGMLLLEPGAASAVLYQEQMARTGLINETSFPVPEDVNFLLVNVPNAIQRGSALLREGNTAAGGWFVSRAIQAHLLNRLVPSRAEVVLRQGTGKAPALLSSVNHPMGPVFYLDESHQYWKAAEISPGHAVPLEQCNKTEFETWYGTVFSEPSANLKARAKHVVGRPGWFYAQASKASDFWIPTSPQIRWMRDEMLCCGPVKAPALNTVKEVNP